MWTFFNSQWQRAPTAEEFGRMVENKVQEEVLYREAVAMGLDKDDTIVKRRMAQKLQFLAEDVAAAYEPGDAELEDWYAANADKFALPGRISFRQLYFSRTSAAGRPMLTRRRHLRPSPINRWTRNWPRASAIPSCCRTITPTARPSRLPGVWSRLRAGGFGAATGSWQGPVESGFGWHLVFVDSFVPGANPPAEVAPEVKTAWLAQQRWRPGARPMTRCAPSTPWYCPCCRTLSMDCRQHRWPVATTRHRNEQQAPPIRFSPGRLLGLLTLLCLIALPAAQAHEARPAYLELTETAPGQYTVLWRTPVLAGRPPPLALTLPEDVNNLREPIVQELTDSLVERRWIDAGPGGLAGKRITFTGLQFTITDVLARVQLQDGRSWTIIARPAQPWIEITAALSGWQVASEYIVQGMRHILFGPDHLLFVLGLLLIVRDGWTLVKPSRPSRWPTA